MPEVADSDVVAESASFGVGDPTENPCGVMREAADTSERMERLEDHLTEAAMEAAIRRYYRRNVLARGIDRRALARHPVIFSHLGIAPGDAVARCVEDWRVKDPNGIVPDAQPGFAADHRYAEVTFELNDAPDGENAYTAFVDVATMQVMAMFHYNNFQP